MLLPFLTLVPLLFVVFPPSSHAFPSDISFFYPKDMGFHTPFHSSGFPYYNRFLRTRRGSEDGGQGQTPRVEAFRRMYRCNVNVIFISFKYSFYLSFLIDPLLQRREA